MFRRPIFIILLSLAALLAVWRLGFEFLLADPATRLAYQIRDQALLLRFSGEAFRTFEHRPASWPDGLPGDYRIEIKSYPTEPRPGARSIGVARGLTERPRSFTSYHLNYVEVPSDLAAAHQTGEPTLVRLEMREGRVLLTELQ